MGARGLNLGGRTEENEGALRTINARKVDAQVLFGTERLREEVRKAALSTIEGKKEREYRETHSYNFN